MAFNFNTLIQSAIDFVWMVISIFLEMIDTNPLLAVVAIGAACAIAYFTFNFFVGTTWSFAHAGMYFFLVVVILIIAYIAWSQFGVSQSFSEMLMGILGG